jgi:hypothetical protein
MDKKQALAFLKNALDEATSKGAFQNLEYVNALITAYNILAEEINKNIEYDKTTN